jgi:hypothetical protein
MRFAFLSISKIFDVLAAERGYDRQICSINAFHPHKWLKS